MTSSYLRGDDFTAPRRVHADRGAGTVRLEWADGHLSVYDFEALRWLCPCAYCRGETGSPGWLDSNPVLTAEQTRLAALEPVGSYALCPTWGDGHHTGIYTYTSLRAHCPCPACTLARSGSDRRGDSWGAR
ncbi:MAG: DUF971 domain-containing protein [Chloroflexi bacterium]|jgi:DUF971 family protein|nr:DUF971 domain-containing protein [Chloroflexota bacterium]